MTTLCSVLATCVISAGSADQTAAPAPFFQQITIASHKDGGENCWPCMARLSDGRLLVLWAQAKKGSQDYGVLGAFSSDAGATWSKPVKLIDHEGQLDADPSILVSGRRVFVTCTSLPKGAGGISTSTTWCVRSEDDGVTWSAPYAIPMGRRYTCGKTHHGLRLTSGTLLMGYSWDAICEQGKTLKEEGEMDLRAGVMRSTDNGNTWTPGGDTNAQYEKVGGGSVRGTDEPAIVELPDGSVYMLMRTGSTHLYEARSTDEGRTFKDIKPSPLRGSNAPAALCAFNQDGRKGVLVVWDNAIARFPLCAAASFDGARTWSRPRDIGFPYTGGQASYPACDTAKDGTLVAVWQHDVPGGRDIRCARFNVAWLLQDPSAELQKTLSREVLPSPATPWQGYTLGKYPRESSPSWRVHVDRGQLTNEALRLGSGAGAYIDNEPGAWNGNTDKLIEIRMRVVSRESSAPDNHSAAEVWIGGSAARSGCLLLFRQNAVSFNESYEPAAEIDATRFHTYRVVTKNRQGKAFLYIDDGKAPVLAAPLGENYGYTINRILFGDSGGAKTVAGVSDWTTVRWCDVESDEKPRVIVNFGDSTTAPRGSLRTFGVRLQRTLDLRSIPAVVINAGVGGHNTDQARSRLDHDVLSHKPSVVTIWFGLNDCAIDLWKGDTAPRVPIAKYEENLRYFIRTLKSRDALPILMTPNPVAWTDELLKLYGKPPLNPHTPDGYNFLVRQYAEAVRKVAEAEKVPLIDVYRMFDDYAGTDKRRLHDLLLDGMHPNDRGHRMIADEVGALIQ